MSKARDLSGIPSGDGDFNVGGTITAENLRLDADSGVDNQNGEGIYFSNTDQTVVLQTLGVDRLTIEDSTLARFEPPIVAPYFATARSVDGNNIDHMWHDDSANTWHFVSDTTANADGNSTLRAGALGIGTAPATGIEAHIASTSAQLRIEDTDGVRGGAQSSALSLWSGSSNAEHGFVGFGTGAGIMAVTNRAGSLQIQADSENVHASSSITLAVDGTSAMVINGAGDFDVTIGNISDGLSSVDRSLFVEGRFATEATYGVTTATGANVVIASSGLLQRSTSSAQYKTDVETIQDSYADLVYQLRPVWYRSTCEEDNPDWSYYGLIAEEVHEVMPQVVQYQTQEKVDNPEYDAELAETQEDYLVPKYKWQDLETPIPNGVMYDRLVPHLINVVQRQKTEIETLESTQADLIARIEALETN